MIAVTDLERDAVIVVCAISAGIHAALAPSHWGEGIGAGFGFAVSAIVLGALAVLLTRRAPGGLALVMTAAVLSGLLVSYALAITTGLPVLHPQPEPVEELAVFTKAVEAVGLLAAAHLLLRDRVPVVSPIRQPKGMTT